MARRDLTKGPVAGHLARLGLPMVAGIAAVLSISLADTYFLGKLGTEELAAISFTFPVVLVVTSIAIGMSAGAASVLARAIGRGDEHDVRRFATDSLLLTLALFAFVSAAGWLLVRPLFAALGAEGAVLDMVVSYMRPWFIGVPLLAVPMVAMGMIRANGDAVTPSLVMVVGAVINVVVDPILIFGGFGIAPMGVEGAAWATVVARAVTLPPVLAIIVFRERMMTREVPRPGAFADSAWKVLRVGIPAAGSNMINPIAIGVVTAILATYGNEAVAAFGVATRIETLATLPMLALSSAIGPIAGQNWGREKPERTLRAMRDAFLFVVLCGLVLGGGFFLFGEAIARLFSGDSVVINMAVSYLTIVGLTLGGYGIVINASAAYNAIDKAFIGLMFTMLRSLVLYIPLVMVATVYGPPWLVFFGIAATNIIAGALVASLAFLLVRRSLP